MNKPRILVVEDELIVARDIQLQLRELGGEPVGNVTRGEEAVALSGSLRPDLILMDIRLAGAMDGLAAAAAIRAEHAVPIVFLTAFASEADLARLQLSEPPGQVLIKPFDEEELRAVLAQALPNRLARLPAVP